MTNWVVGTSKALPFWQHCFTERRFFKTKPGSEEHVRLWEET